MSGDRYVCETYFGRPIYDGDIVVRTPSGHLIFEDDIEQYALLADDYEIEIADYDEYQRNLKLEYADQIVDMRRGEG